MLTDYDTIDMIKFREEGITYREIGEMYGISESATYKRMKYYKDYKKNRSTAMVAAR
jgi:transposase